MGAKLDVKKAIPVRFQMGAQTLIYISIDHIASVEPPLHGEGCRVLVDGKFYYSEASVFDMVKALGWTGWGDGENDERLIVPRESPLSKYHPNVVETRPDSKYVIIEDINGKPIRVERGKVDNATTADTAEAPVEGE